MKTSTSKHVFTRQRREPPATNLAGALPLQEKDTGDAGRRHRIAEAAYYRAEQRGFCPGCELEDWLEAEKEIDSQLRELASKRP
ncbi:MAG: DUF2934 domain-containing protein [Burkholderiales bacterium]